MCCGGSGREKKDIKESGWRRASEEQGEVKQSRAMRTSRATIERGQRGRAAQGNQWMAWGHQYTRACIREGRHRSEDTVQLTSNPSLRHTQRSSNPNHIHDHDDAFPAADPSQCHPHLESLQPARSLVAALYIARMLSSRIRRPVFAATRCRLAPGSGT